MYLTVKSLLNQINKISHSKVCVLIQNSDLNINDFVGYLFFCFWVKCSSEKIPKVYGHAHLCPMGLGFLFAEVWFWTAGYLVMTAPNTQ